MKFGERLLSSQHPPWSEYYVDYHRLKQLLYPLFELESPDVPRLGDGNIGADAGGGGACGGAGGGTVGALAQDSGGISPANGAAGGVGATGATGGFLPGIHGHEEGSAFLLHHHDHDSPHSATAPMEVAGSNATKVGTSVPISAVISPTGPFARVNKVTTSHEFQKELNLEIQKALLFILKSMGELSEDLSVLMKQQRFMSYNVHALLNGELSALGSIPEVSQVSQMQTRQQRIQAQKQIIKSQQEEICNLRMEYLVRIGTKLLLLLEFVEINIEAVSKTVKKHDKFLANWELQHKTLQRTMSFSSNSSGGQHGNDAPSAASRYQRLRRQYLPRFAMYSSDPNLRCLFLLAADAGDGMHWMGGQWSRGQEHLQNQQEDRYFSGRLGSQLDGSFGGWDVMQWNLEMSLRELFGWNQSLQKKLDAITAGPDLTASLSRSGKSVDASTVSDDTEANLRRKRSQSISSSNLHQKLDKRRSFKQLVSTSSNFLSGLVTAASPSPTRRNQSKKPDKDSFFEPMLYRIQSHRQRLGQSTHRYIRMVYAHEMVHLIDDGPLPEEEEKYMMHKDVKKLMDDSTPMVSKLSKFLNLASSCLYAKLLGFDPANAGIIIGMTPMAVIGSSVLYSWWSSYSYKRALIFASCCCIVGNMVYALALPCNSLKMVLAGRLLTGFGSARVINRRYIADYYSIQDRTSGMADFVSAGAFGMAVGPGLAALLSAVAPSKQTDTDSWWTIETAPGYVMFGLWFVYLICNIIFFEEPDRTELTATKVQKDEEKGGKGGNTNGTMKPKDGSVPSENTPLIKPQHASLSIENSKAVKSSKLSQSKSRCNIPVVTSLMLLVVLKTVIEGLMSSAPTVSRYYFDWGVHASGIYLAAVASLMLPANYVVAQVSRKYDDRELIIVTLAMILIGVLGFLVYEGSYSETRFILFGFVIFVACNALEGPTMGLLSKTIPKKLAKGVLNAGLLATESGTLGRVIGDFWLSSAAFKGMDKVVNHTFEPMALMVAASILVTFWAYPHLQPRYEDEDEDD